nr:MAG TPA: Protein of unknown function (DUF2577) [Caudoviricetes sp.]
MNSNGWDYELGSLFRERDNPKTKMGAMLGKVVSTSPPVVTIQNGKYTIKGEQLYVAYHLLERKSAYSSMNQSGSITVSCPHGGGSYTSTSSGDIQLEEVWKAGDLVLVIPSESEQQFFIVDVVRQLKGCNSQSK